MPDQDQTQDDVCQTRCVHPEAIQAALNNAPDSETIEDLAAFYKLFADPTRLRIIHALHAAEMCVCDLSEALSMTPSAASHQLRLLRAAKLVKYRRQGKKAFYSLDDEHIALILQAGLDHVREDRR
jgi:ArsR family transcriptional regulator, lead/cadmium/zinc/bismuth-responsive transcriptional repressor